MKNISKCKLKILDVCRSDLKKYRSQSRHCKPSS